MQEKNRREYNAGSNYEPAPKRLIAERRMASLFSVCAVAMCFIGCPSQPEETQPEESVNLSGIHYYVQNGTPLDRNGRLSINAEGIRLGQGYDPVKETWLGNCVENVGVDTLTGGTAQQTTYNVDSVESTSELMQQFSVSTKVQLNLGDDISGGAEFKLGVSKQINRYSSNIVVRISVAEQERTMGQNLLKKWVLDRFAKDPSFVSSGRFAELCGSGFASGYKSGGELVLLFSRDNTSTTDKKELESGLQAKIFSFFQGNISVKDELQKNLAETQTKMYFYASGAVVQLPTFDNMLALVQAFPAQVAQSKGWPSQIRITPYSLIENYPNIDSPADWKAERVLRTLAERRTVILPIYFDDMYIDNHRGQFEQIDLPALQESMRVGSRSLKAIEDAARKCYEQNTCELPVPMPEIPKRPSDEVTPDPLISFTAIWKRFTDCKPGEEKVDGKSPKNCDLIRSCDQRGRWSTGTVERCTVCTDGTRQPCACPECGNGTQVCSKNVWGACSCNQACPKPSLTPDGAKCSGVLSSRDIASFTCTATPENSIFSKVPIPAECLDQTNYSCELVFDVKDRVGSCHRDSEVAIEVKCENTHTISGDKYTSAVIGGGLTNERWLLDSIIRLGGATGGPCRSSVDFWKRANASGPAGSCGWSGCIRVVENIKIVVKTRGDMCTF
jgi:hypothetical protein